MSAARGNIHLDGDEVLHYPGVARTSTTARECRDASAQAAGALNAVVASDLARSSPPVETFLASAGEVIRIVRRRDRGMSSRTTLAATHRKDGPLTSGEAEAAFLRRGERPNWGMGAESVRFADLFCGCGSLALGTLEAARALHMRGELRLAADIDLNALRVLRASLGVDAHTAARWNLTRHVKADPTALTSASEREMVARVGSALRIAVAGPPCQGHSALNNHSRHDDVRNHLYLRVVRFAALTEPDYVLIENVASIENDRRRSVERATEGLLALGYHVDAALVDLNLLGVPQLRRRHVLVACGPHVRTLSVKDVVAAHAVDDQRSRTLSWAIDDLESMPGKLPFDHASVSSPDNARRIAWLHEHNADDLPNPLRPPCHQGLHTYKSMYGRLHWDRPAQTITSGYGSMGQGRYVHPRQRRTLTPHEAARLQMFPDFFDFSSVTSRGAWAQMIGNAAPWKLAYAFALEMLR
jgi:DNA (cytosine-5)-methyltransferase 1